MSVLRFNNRTELSAYFKQQGGSDPNTYYLIEFCGLLYKGAPDRRGFIDVAQGFSKVFCGARLFQLRATHGLPLGDALVRITEAGYPIDWTEFLKEARKNGWWDFQSLDAIQQAFVDADYSREEGAEIIKRMKVWIAENPLTTQE